MINRWRSCKYNPPMQYTRVEIKDHSGKRYVGYRYKQDYYETFGNFKIADPYKWRRIPEESWLWKEIRMRLLNPNNYGLKKGMV